MSESPKYLYLREVTHAHTWVEGGRVPLSLASSYLAQERKGIFTPDENNVIKIREHAGHPAFVVADEKHRSQTFTWLSEDPDGRIVRRYMDVGYVDGVVLCLSNSRNDETWFDAGKRACVQIDDVLALQVAITESLADQSLLPSSPNWEVTARMHSCEYTETAQRDAFTKGKEDSWQDEFRMFWLVRQNVLVEIPAGLARLIWVSKA